MNKNIFTCAVLFTAFLLGCACAFGGEPYLNLSYSSGGYAMSVDYGCGQSARIYEGGHPLALQTNQVPEAIGLVLELDRRNSDRAAAAIGTLRAVAPPIVAGNPCPQQCCTVRTGYCGRTYTTSGSCCTTTQPYCGTSRPTCASPCGTTPYWCARTNRWCGRGTYWCGQTRRWYYASTGYPCAMTAGTQSGSCCSSGDGRNGMVLYPPGDPRGVCWCAHNRNGRGTSCACPSNCPTCNPNNIVGYGG